MSAAAALLLDVAVKSLLVCLLAAMAAAAARRMSAAFRHDLWLAALICCLLLPSLSALPLVAGPIADVGPVHIAANAIATSLPPGSSPQGLAVIDRIWSGDGGALLPDRLIMLLVGVWIAGAATVFARWVTNYRVAAAVARRAAPFPIAHLSRVCVRLTDEVAAPALFGWRRPVILLPLTATQWSPSRLRAVIAHEEAHVARGDCAIEWLVELVCALHWFNPFVLAAARRLRAERELACDERALAAGIRPSDYADALLGVARGARARGPLIAMSQTSELERRVRSLLSDRRVPQAPIWMRRGFAVLAVCAFAPIAALTAPAAGVLAAGSVQPDGGTLTGLDDPLSERVPLPYDELLRQAQAVLPAGPDAAGVAELKSHLDRRSKGYGDLVRERAIWALTQTEQGRLFEPLAARVSDRDWRFRAYAAWGLAVTDQRATPMLVPMLDDPVWRVRAMAAAALAELADPAAAEAVARAANDPAWQVRITTLKFVERVGDSRLAHRLRPLLDDPHQGTRMKAHAVLNRI